MAAYADFTYYGGTFLGTAIASADFPRLALRASAVIDQVTFDQAAAVVLADTETAVIDKIQMAVCAVAEEIQVQESNGGIDGITSERVGNQSVSYGSNSKAALSNEQKQQRAAKLYLASTGLMYRGVYPVNQSTDAD
jgi:hypothetical protein